MTDKEDNDRQRLNIREEDKLSLTMLNLLTECWGEMYIEIDLVKGVTDSFLEAAKKIVHQYFVDIGEFSKIRLLRFFVQLGSQSATWLSLAKPNELHPFKILALADEILKTEQPVFLHEIRKILPEQLEPTGDMQADEAYLMLEYLGEFMCSHGDRIMASQIFYYAVTSHSVVIPEGQRRKLLRWCLEEGIPAAYTNREPFDLGEFIWK